MPNTAPAPAVPDPRVEALARLAVEVGANMQPGQVLAVNARPLQEDLAHAVAAAAYRNGARYVDLGWFDPHIKHARLQHAPDDTLDWVPPWLGERMRRLGELEAAIVALTGPTAPGLFDDVDPVRAGRDRLPSVREGTEIIMAGAVNWTVVPCPNPAWAALVFPDLPAAGALERLWTEIAHVCRLDEPDPAAAWRQRAAELEASAAHLNTRRFRSLRFVGPGTDLTVGLMPGSTWIGGTDHRRDGLVHMANIPTEEVFTAPDPVVTHGVVTSTRPLDVGGTVVRGLRMRFEGGRAVEVTADSGLDVLRARMAVDEGASRLGEVALVDASGRIGPLGTVFYDTLLDENATSHIAVGAAYPFTAAPDEAELINHSEIHIDFMIGGPEVTVLATDAAGRETPLLEGGRWVR